ncbi:MAG: amidohydrolase [Chloroflexota bacterium]|nr:amidohydrolase [Chloroflexota bacterium]
MARILLKHADIITLNDENEVLRGVDVAIEGKQIAHIGDIPGGWMAEETLDLTDHVIMPGFWNAHTHSPMTFVRSIGDDLPLDRWFNEKIWVAESGLTEEDVYWGALLAAAEMIRSGTVGFADHYFHMHRVAEVVEQSGLKALLATALFGTGQEVSLSFEESVGWANHLRGAADGRIRTTLGPHSPYLCPPEFLEEVAEAAQREGLGVHIHLAESEEQVNVSMEKYGRTPVEHLHSLGVFEVPTIAAHCIAVSEKDMDILAEQGVVPVQCPQCHMKLAMGVTPVPAMLERGIPVALGTDGPGSNNNLDMLEEAQLAPLMQRLHLGDATSLPGDLPLRLATTHGARAMGFPNSGTLRPDAAADLIVLDFRHPHLQPRLSIIGNVLYAANSGDIVHSMVDGRWLMRDRKLLTLDETHILAEAEKRALAMNERGKTLLRKYEG